MMSKVDCMNINFQLHTMYQHYHLLLLQELRLATNGVDNPHGMRFSANGKRIFIVSHHKWIQKSYSNFT